MWTCDLVIIAPIYSAACHSQVKVTSTTYNYQHQSTYSFYYTTMLILHTNKNYMSIKLHTPSDTTTYQSNPQLQGRPFLETTQTLTFPLLDDSTLQFGDLLKNHKQTGGPVGHVELTSVEPMRHFTHPRQREQLHWHQWVVTHRDKYPEMFRKLW